MRFRAPAVVFLRRAQLILILAGLVPTVLMTATGIVILATQPKPLLIAVGVLVVAFCTSVVAGIILVWVFLVKGASLARFQHDYLATVSHELRTPITSIRLFIETLNSQENLEPEEKSKCLDLLEQELDRLDALVSRLFDLSRIESGAHGFERAPVLVSDVVQDALSSFEATALRKRVDIEMELEPELIVEGDHAALVRVVANLLTNAWKYTPDDDKQIQLAARALDAKYVEISVSDNGPGLDRAEQREVFDQFKRGRAASDSGAAGSGLGLAIVRAIVRAHRGGRVEIRSKDGAGAEFCIRLRRLAQKPL